MDKGKRLRAFDAELRAAGISPFAGLPWYGSDGRRDNRVALQRLPLRWAVSAEFWDRYFAPLLLRPGLSIEYGGWPVEVVEGPPGEWVRLEPR